jgi:hypothetical protein
MEEKRICVADQDYQSKNNLGLTYGIRESALLELCNLLRFAVSIMHTSACCPDIDQHTVLYGGAWTHYKQCALA